MLGRNTKTNAYDDECWSDTLRWEKDTFGYKFGINKCVAYVDLDSHDGEDGFCRVGEGKESDENELE